MKQITLPDGHIILQFEDDEIKTDFSRVEVISEYLEGLVGFAKALAARNASLGN